MITIKTNRGLCPHPAGATAPAPGLPGALPPDPHNSPLKAAAGTSKDVPATPDIVRILAVKGRSAIPPPLRGEHMLTFPLDSSPICSKTEEMSIFEGLFLENFFSDNILELSLSKYIFVFSSIWKKGANNI